MNAHIQPVLTSAPGRTSHTEPPHTHSQYPSPSKDTDLSLSCSIDRVPAASLYSLLRGRSHTLMGGFSHIIQIITCSWPKQSSYLVWLALQWKTPAQMEVQRENVRGLRLCLYLQAQNIVSLQSERTEQGTSELSAGLQWKSRNTLPLPAPLPAPPPLDSQRSVFTQPFTGCSKAFQTVSLEPYHTCEGELQVWLSPASRLGPSSKGKTEVIQARVGAEAASTLWLEPQMRAREPRGKATRGRRWLPSQI